jgi:hypothetical protein
VNGAEDSTYPYCCENKAKNEYCCLGEWINPTCSEPTTTTPVPIIPKSKYAGKVYSKYEDTHSKGDFDTGSTRKTEFTGTSGEGLIDVRVPETGAWVPDTVGVTKTITATEITRGDFTGRTIGGTEVKGRAEKKDSTTVGLGEHGKSSSRGIIGDRKTTSRTELTGGSHLDSPRDRLTGRTGTLGKSETHEKTIRSVIPGHTRRSF